MIDLSQLPAPAVVEVLDFEAQFQETLANFRAAMGDNWSASMESDPVMKLLEESTWQKLLLRARVNDAAQASLLAYAKGADLDNRGADYDVPRLVITPADPDAVPPVEAVLEDDESYRYRIRLSLEALSSAGSRGAYEYLGRSASGQVASVSVDSPTFVAAQISADLRAQLPAGAIVLVCDYDAGLANPLPGDVSIAVLGVEGAMATPAELVSTVQASLSADEVRPITDRPRVQYGTATGFSVVATLEIGGGPSKAVVLANARAALDKAIAAARALQGELPRSAIYAALHVTGVRRVVLTQPTADVICDKRHYPSKVAVDIQGLVLEEGA